MRHRYALLTVIVIFFSQTVAAGPIRDRLVDRRTVAEEEESERFEPVGALPEGVRRLGDIPYGEDPRQHFDVYLPTKAQHAPVIFMVHGGAWRTGDKASRAVVQNKVARWVPRGFIFISANYRLLPRTHPLAQADDVARALATAQARAGSWGGDASKFILIGHSAGAHLVALLAAAPAKAWSAGTKPWLGTILLDSAALDVERIMNARHARIYDSAFGKQQSYWRTVSPFHALSASASPILAVCSTRRLDSCSQARAFTARAAALGASARLVGQDLSHRAINETLGTQGAYTDVVEMFMGTLEPSVMRALAPAEGRKGEK